VGFYHVAHQYYRDIRKHSPKSVLIIDSYDLCFLRERRKAELSGDPGEIWKALEIKRQELSMYRNADMVLTVTEEDRRKLIEEAPDLSVGISTDIHPVEAAGTCADRKDLLFVGNYNHDPNVDAVLYFVEEIFPRIKQQLPDVKLRIVGNAPTERIKQLAADDIIVTGFVPEVTPYLLESRVFVVPLRYGAGLKGKIGEALGCGIPIVTTSIGAEGMNLVHRKNSMIADDPESFARCVIEVCGDDSLCGTLSREGQEHAKRNYSFETVEEYWKEVIEFIGRGRREGPKRIREKRVPGFTRPASVPELAPEVGIVVPVHDNLDVTRSCWASIRKNTGIPYDLVLVDNGSAEDVAYEADQNNIRVIRNDSNKGFAHACNQGIRHTHGDFVVILNNDTIATPGWLERLVWHARGDARIGIVGPSTSFAAGPQQIPTSYRSEKDLYDFSEGLYSKNRHSHVDVDKVVGVCMVLRRAMLEDVGLFDTRFGIGNYEDDDICLRARLGGYRVVWAKDVFVHHKGSVTFRSIGMDYGKIIEENRQKYISKWAPVAAEFAPQGGVARAARPRVEGDSTMVVVGDGRTDAAETVKTIEEYSERPAIALARCLPVSGERSDLMVIAETDGSPLSRTVIEFVEASQGDAVFFVRAGAVLTPGWTKPLEAALADETVGCALPSCNVGWGEQLEKPTYSKTGKPLVKFARRNALKWRGTVTDIEIGFPAALAISRKNLVKHGLPGEFVTSASLLDLQRRVSDSGLRVVCARDSYVHMDGRDTELWATERDAVTNLLDARKAVARECVDAAIQHLDHAIRFKPDYAEALYERGVLRALKGMDDDAASDFDGVLRAVPSDSRAHNNLGCIHFRRGRTGDAEKSFKTAIEVDNENWEAKKNLADLHMSTGRPDSATSLYSSIIEEHGECPDVYASLGEVFAAHGDLATAEYLFKIALRLSPDNVAAKQGLGVVDLARANLNNAGGEGLGESRAEPLSLHDSPE
jgi:GT2 family glycosyltransferase/Tfp pilus assembly protein PilF